MNISLISYSQRSNFEPGRRISYTEFRILARVASRRRSVILPHPVLLGSKNGPVVVWPRDTTTIIVTKAILLHNHMELTFLKEDWLSALDRRHPP